MTLRLTRRLLIGALALALNDANAQAQEQAKPVLVNPELPHSVLRLPNIHPGRDAVYAYAKELLTEALNVTAQDYGTFELIVSTQETAQERQHEEEHIGRIRILHGVAYAEGRDQERRCRQRCPQTPAEDWHHEGIEDSERRA